MDELLEDTFFTGPRFYSSVLQELNLLKVQLSILSSQTAFHSTHCLHLALTLQNQTKSHLRGL